MTRNEAKKIIIEDVCTWKIEQIITEHDEGYLHEFIAMNLIREVMNKWEK